MGARNKEQKAPKKVKIRTSLTIHPDYFNKARVYAKFNKLSLSKFIESVLADYFRRVELPSNPVPQEEETNGTAADSF